ncbi:MAG TPA: hypothetical protein VLI93_06645 [Acetobacteraceae bacterium]|nr:hypothetical protein [Acetobacteraceae bacterium]
MRTILLTTIFTVGMVLAAIPHPASTLNTAPTISTGYSPAHVAQPGSRGSVVDI